MKVVRVAYLAQRRYGRARNGKGRGILKVLVTVAVARYEDNPEDSAVRHRCQSCASRRVDCGRPLVWLVQIEEALYGAEQAESVR